MTWKNEYNHNRQTYLTQKQRERRQKLKTQISSNNNNQCYQAHNIKVLLSLKEYTELNNAAYSRKSEKKRGNSKYTNDAGYWDGGRCNYGGAHSLQEDCEKLAGFFAEITELKNLQKELLAFTNQKEFDKNKQNLLTKIDNYINGLNMKTSSNTSIGGVCIIWNDFKEHFDTQISNFRKDLELLKSNVERVPYNEAKDKWKKLLERKQQLKTARLGDNFNPEAHVDKFFKELEDKLNKRNPTRPINPPRSTPTNNPNNPFDLDNNTPPPSSSFFIPTNDKEPQSLLEKYWKYALLIGVYLIGSYFILNQKDKDNHG